MEDMLQLAHKIHDRYCKHCKDYKPLHKKTGCSFYKNIIKPLLNGKIVTNYTEFYLSRSPYKNGECEAIRWKENE